jgi:hypothetical protein
MFDFFHSGIPIALPVRGIPFCLYQEERMLLASFPGDTDENGCLEGRYANYFKVGHNAYEFVIDFGQAYEDDARKERIHSRIITSPVYAKGLLETLRDAIEQHEANFGRIAAD